MAKTRKARSYLNMLKKKAKNLSRRVRKMFGMRGGHRHTWVATGAKLSDVKWRCSGCGKSCTSEAKSGCPN